MNIDKTGMKILLLIITMALMCMTGISQKRWQKEGVKIPPPICYASDDEHAHFIEAPDQFLKRLKSTQQRRSTILVEYVGFEDEPRAAFQYAVDIWEHLIASPIPIHIYARWTELEDRVLGSCGPFTHYENFDSAPYKDRYYPVALVAKLENKVLTSDTNPDMIAQFNSAIDNWYFGTDGQTPSGQFDFVTVVLHEIAHGLGFTGFFYEQGGQGAYGDLLPYPGIFDEFVINGEGEQLTDTSLFANPSEELLQQFRSNNLYYESLTAQAKSSNDSFPRLYAPNDFDEGSSIYHLDEDIYEPGDTNSLMTPFFDRAEAIHSPGPFTMAILTDMGWDYTSIIHEELPDLEVVTGPIEVTAYIITDSEIDSSSVRFIYSINLFETADTIPLIYSTEDSLFFTSLDGIALGDYSYYLSVEDTSGQTFYLPGAVPDVYFEFSIGPDTELPEAYHEPVSFMLESNLTAEIIVEATDNIGIQDVTIEYMVNDGSPQNRALAFQGDDIYQTSLELEGLSDGDSVRYRIIITDSSINSNQVFLPEEEGYYTIYIDGFNDPVDSYTNDFNMPSRDFISSDFYIGTEDLFSDGALHSPHPYPSPDEENKTIDLVAILKYPIVLDDQALMSFREVVLVEPGDTGSIFGDEDFWDYVIIEGSKSGTDNWLPLIDGYDSSDNDTWETNYNASIQGGNSTTAGRASYYINREFKMTENGNFREGDTLFIRFRLFSDPFAHGWGWAIDDLKIQDPSTDINEPAFSPGELLVYPNPARTNLFVQGSFKSTVGQLTISIFNGFGQLVSNELVGIGSNQLMHSFDVRSLGTGLYLIAFQFENGQTITRKFVKQ